MSHPARDPRSGIDGQANAARPTRYQMARPEPL